MSVTRYGGKPVFRLFASEACPAQPPAVRSGTDAQIVLIAPIYQIMAALLTRPGVVADLISRNASRRRHCASHLEQIGGMVRIEIGREAWRERGCAYVENAGGAGILKKKKR